MSPLELFAWPEALPCLLLAPLIWLLLHGVDRFRARRLRSTLGPRAAALTSSLGSGQRAARRRLMTAGFLLALLAVIQPLWGEGLRKIKQRGVDLLVCLDLSQSMLARDVPPSRLERAKSELCALADRARGDRLGLVVFAGEARLQIPLTQDMDSFQEMTVQADPLLVRQSGTDLGAALEAALEALTGSSGEHEAVLLLTDGEDLEERGLRAAKKCRERKIRVHCVGFGSVRGSKIAVQDEEGAAFLRDRSGKEVVSAMDPEGLSRIAEAAGGRFMDAATRTLPLVHLYERQVVPMARKAFDTAGLQERRNRFQWPLLGALLLWLMAFGLSERRSG